jgi:hypothetical protein
MSIYQYRIPALLGGDIQLADYQGKVMLLVKRLKVLRVNRKLKLKFVVCYY